MFCAKRMAVASVIGIILIGTTMTAFAAENIEDYRAVFDATYYYEQYPDLQTSIGPDSELLFAHFVKDGVKEGRSGNSEFNLKAYIYNNPDLFLTFKKDLSKYCKHFTLFGKNEGRIALRQEEQGNIIGSWTTYYDPSLPRTTNLELAAERINGMILEPGERMSFSDSILPRTIENGYVWAPAIKRNEIGGGICQVSSTLYAAMCQALIPAIERYPHSQPITYLPEGLDATISEGHKDLKFENPYDKPIQILATADNGVLTTTIKFLNEDKEANPDVVTMTQGLWREDSFRWWYDNEDGTYKQNGWYWIDGNSDGYAECYYFDNEGWMLANCITPDGFTVDMNGAWIENGIVQRQLIEHLN